MSSPLRRVWDLLSIYLPLILMGVLALVTWWLVRSAPGAAPTILEAPLRHESDYFMRNFSIKTFDSEGRLKSEISGAMARHFPDTDTIEIEQIRLRSFSATGGTTSATADRALTNGDGSEVQLFGNAWLRSEAHSEPSGRKVPAGEFRSQFLHAFMNTERLTTHSPVHLARGNDQLSADAMEFDNLARVLTLQGHVRGELHPKAMK